MTPVLTGSRRKEPRVQGLCTSGTPSQPTAWYQKTHQTQPQNRRLSERKQSRCKEASLLRELWMHWVAGIQQ